MSAAVLACLVPPATCLLQPADGRLPEEQFHVGLFVDVEQLLSAAADADGRHPAVAATLRSLNSLQGSLWAL